MKNLTRLCLLYTLKDNVSLLSLLDNEESFASLVVSSGERLYSANMLAPVTTIGSTVSQWSDFESVRMLKC